MIFSSKKEDQHTEFKIISCFVEAGLPEPIFENSAGGVQLTFTKDLNKDFLSTNQISILKEIQKNNKITQLQLAETIGINEKNIRNNIKRMKEMGLLERIGNTRNGYWKVVKIKNAEFRNQKDEG